jgi:hypothetical protein
MRESSVMRLVRQLREADREKRRLEEIVTRSRAAASVPRLPGARRGDGEEHGEN